MSETILTGPFLIPQDGNFITEGYINDRDYTTLHTGGGYAGDINLVAGGYGNVNTVNAPSLPFFTSFGSWVQNNYLLVGVVLTAVLLIDSRGGRRR